MDVSYSTNSDGSKMKVDWYNCVHMLGGISTYGGGGYVFELRGDEKSLLLRTKELETQAWIDRYTRAILIEFTVYNPGTNLFSVNTMVLEKPNSGSFHSRWRYCMLS